MNESNRDPSGNSAVPSASDIQRLIAAELPLPGKLGFVLLLLAGSSGAGLVGTLALTEPDLPARTRVAFTIVVLIALAWAAFAGWVLARRRVLFGRQRLVAARMAVAFTSLFVLGGAALAFGDRSEVGRSAVGVGLFMLAIAAWLLVRARRHVAALARRRDEIERRLGVLREDVR